VNLKILLFNNRIYGLTKGQYSPTSEVGKITKSTPAGSLDYPFNPISLAIGAEATFVARTIDSDRKHLVSTLRAAAEHEGTALVEIYQNCNIFNDGAWEVLKDNDTAADYLMHLVDGEPIVFGKDGQNAVIRNAAGSLEIVATESVSADQIIRHDANATDPAYAYALSRLSDPNTLANTPIGVFRSVKRPVYDAEFNTQIASETARRGPGDLAALIRGKDAWTVD
jgi:2-oxoglutarate ferredoxin oxidoreductase subunit beta